jgi:hypothetical protein
LRENEDRLRSRDSNSTLNTDCTYYHKLIDNKQVLVECSQCCSQCLLAVFLRIRHCILHKFVLPASDSTPDFTCKLLALCLPSWVIFVPSVIGVTFQLFSHFLRSSIIHLSSSTLNSPTLLSSINTQASSPPLSISDSAVYLTSLT